ncbi:hypothetical protein QR685DRAFT_432961 [Neurospora intermedia]|uniref:HIT-type domain-containing protein n=1 Tax=Neurospora intermedia TaxID=5142 RepID=A0ABR3DS85_NEUIN
MNNFGVIEVASQKTKNAPGWAYVPDTGLTPAAAAALQPLNRKRAARDKANVGAPDLTARQDAKIRKDLEALDKDSHRDAQIPIPPKAGGTRAQNKHTPNVRKILQSQKTFANHLDDYQAFLALAESNPQLAAQVNKPTPTSTTTATTTARKSPAPSTITTATIEETITPDSSEPFPLPRPDTPTSLEPSTTATPPPTTTEQPKLQSYPPDGTILPAYNRPPPTPHPGDDDPLLVSRVPPFPTDEELRALITAPPLSYLEARAQWTEEEEGRYPARRFCEVCGYWGRVKCIKCGARVCALECLEAHREECLVRYGL